MRVWCLTTVITFMALSAQGQFRIAIDDQKKLQKPSGLWAILPYKPDPMRTARLTTPLMLARYSFSPSNTVYWMSSITTQSFNQGKFGTFYFWDLQGNLAESKFFFDIAGKNKRGLKIVIPRRY